MNQIVVSPTLYVQTGRRFRKISFHYLKSFTINWIVQNNKYLQRCGIISRRTERWDRRSFESETGRKVMKKILSYAVLPLLAMVFAAGLVTDTSAQTRRRPAIRKKAPVRRAAP